MQPVKPVIAGCLLGSALAASRTTITATIAASRAEVTLESRYPFLGIATPSTIGDAIQIEYGERPEQVETASFRALRGPRMNHSSPKMRTLIDSVLSIYFFGAAWSLLCFCHMLRKFAFETFDWRPFIIPVTAGFAFLPLGLAGLLVFKREDGTCSYANSTRNFIIPISDLGSCGNRSYNVPELLTELVIVAAISSCLYAQMLARYFERQFEGKYWPTLASHVIRALGFVSMAGLVGVAVIPTYLSRLPHRTAAYAFFLASIWMLFLYSILVIFLPVGTRTRFICPAILAVFLWFSMTVYGVLFTFNFCERICGGATFDLEPQSEEMQLDVMAQYNKYRPLPSK
ncbi:Methenyltetrahydrofolate cyclohydrolase [Durusdinium trenchii]|uniref:Methenyltetrahydrofolate cyclohydrolase n=1 Tax=Durusdinium trenchii TaxID=1381693 RepID=A0ABP0JPZ8_9DINO